MTRALTVVLLAAIAGCTAPDSAGAARARMERILAGATEEVRHLRTGPFLLAVHAEPATASRVERFAVTLSAGLSPFFPGDHEPIQVFVFEKRPQFTRLLAEIRETPGPHAETMGAYHPPTRSVVCSLEWGLGWLGDLMVRALLDDDWRAKAVRANGWFPQGFVSMLYNCFRTPDGRFMGLNVVSYYRPQVQHMAAEGKLLPLRRLLSGDYDEAALEEDAVRKQAREFLAWIHAQGRLADFYREFRRDAPADPSGRSTVERMTGRSLDEVERDWLAWLLSSDGEIGASAMGKVFPVLGVLMKRAAAEDPPGVVVVPVEHSPALRAGLRSRDRILRLDDTPTPTAEALVAALAESPYGASVRLKIVRDGAEHELTVVLDRTIDG